MNHSNLSTSKSVTDPSPSGSKITYDNEVYCTDGTIVYQYPVCMYAVMNRTLMIHDILRKSGTLSLHPCSSSELSCD